MADRTCSVEGCDRPHYSLGCCLKHYRRLKSNDSVELPSAYQRFMSNVQDAGGCTVWVGSRNSRGYGVFGTGGRRYLAHRWLLGHLRGQHLAQGEHGLHRCDNPPCVKPEHLYIGDHRANMNDRDIRGRTRNGKAGRTHCKRGHEYSKDNTARERDGSRRCRACHAANERLRRGARVAA